MAGTIYYKECLISSKSATLPICDLVAHLTVFYCLKAQYVGREPIVCVVLLDIYQQTPDTSGEPHLQCHRKYNIRYFQQWFAIGRDGRENCCRWLCTMLQNEPGSKMVYMKLRLRFSMLLMIQVLYWELYLSKFAEFFPSSPSLKLEGKGNNFEVLQTLFFLLPKLFK